MSRKIVKPCPLYPRTYDPNTVEISFGDTKLPGTIDPDSYVEVDTPEQSVIEFSIEIPHASFVHAFGEPLLNPATERDLEGSWLWH